MRAALINGVMTPAPAGAVAWKYADPEEDARWVMSDAEAREIAAADPSLLVPVRNVRPGQWGFAQVRAWVERHGGNGAGCARRLGGITPGQLGAWMADPAIARTARDVPRAVQAHMETLDRYEPGMGYGT